MLAIYTFQGMLYAMCQVVIEKKKKPGLLALKWLLKAFLKRDGNPDDYYDLYERS